LLAEHKQGLAIDERRGRSDARIGDGHGGQRLPVAHAAVDVLNTRVRCHCEQSVSKFALKSVDYREHENQHRHRDSDTEHRDG